MESGSETLTKDAIESILTSYLEGEMTRKDLSQWGKRKNSEHRPSSPDGSQIDDKMAYMAFFAICSATLNEENLSIEEPPYFMRESDYREWLSSIRRQDVQQRTKSQFQRLRPHQVSGLLVDSPIYFNADPEVLTEILGFDHLRGLDDLDYFQEYLFQMQGQQLFTLIRYMRSPVPNAFALCSNHDLTIEVVETILDLLSVKRRDIVWCHPELSLPNLK